MPNQGQCECQEVCALDQVSDSNVSFVVSILSKEWQCLALLLSNSLTRLAVPEIMTKGGSCQEGIGLTYRHRRSEKTQGIHGVAILFYFRKGRKNSNIDEILHQYAAWNFHSRNEDGMPGRTHPARRTEAESVVQVELKLSAAQAPLLTRSQSSALVIRHPWAISSKQLIGAQTIAVFLVLVDGSCLARGRVEIGFLSPVLGRKCG